MDFKKYINVKAEKNWGGKTWNSWEKEKEDFPGGSVVKNMPAKAGDSGSIPGPGKFHVPQGNHACLLQLEKALAKDQRHSQK